MVSRSFVALDLGPIAAPAPWNSLADPVTGRLEQLLDGRGRATSISVEVVDAFHDVNVYGWDALDPELGIPRAAGRDGFWGNGRAYKGKVEEKGALQWQGLDPSKLYKLEVFASRRAQDARTGVYRLMGAGADSAILNPSDNVSRAITLQARPTQAGELMLEVSAADSLNESAQQAFYLGAAILSWMEADQATGQISFLSPSGSEHWQAGAEVQLSWTSTWGLPIEVSAEVDGASQHLATLPATATDFKLRVPACDSLRLSLASGAQKISSPILAIDRNRGVHPIVVIGSSTAAGAGASVPDSAWVNRYRVALLGRDTRFPVVNLAQGGYTTCHLMPDGMVSRACSVQPDSLRNISRALALNPSAIVVNLPSNDAAAGIPLEATLRNFEAIRAAAGDVSLWIASPQPRNGMRPERMALQRATLEALSKEERSVDFWTGLAVEDGTIDPVFDSGDGVHLNDAGHRLLFERVEALDIPGNCGEAQSGSWEVMLQDTVLAIRGEALEWLDWHWVEREGQLSAWGEVRLDSAGWGPIGVPRSVAAGNRWLHLRSRETLRGDVLRLHQEGAGD